MVLVFLQALPLTASSSVSMVLASYSCELGRNTCRQVGWVRHALTYGMRQPRKPTGCATVDVERRAAKHRSCFASQKAFVGEKMASVDERP